MDNDIKNLLKQYIKLLSETLETSDKLTKIEFQAWIPNCIECLQFALDNEQLLIEKPSLYEDTLATLSLLYKWIFEETQWAYIELYRKFRTIYSGAEVGNALKALFNKLNENKIKEPENNCLVDYKDGGGNLKSVHQVCAELSEQWNKTLK